MHMKYILTIILTLTFSFTKANEWQPQWKNVTLPNIEAQTNIGLHHSKLTNGDYLFWVYLSYPEPRPAKYLSGKLFIAELQEWVVNCKELTGGIPTIRYTNNSIPGAYKDFALVHPGGKEHISSKQVGAICELGI